jgi:Uma2 family endonuclease
MLSPEQYLEIECRAEFKSEYFHGEVFPVLGASPMHSLIATNVAVELSTQLKRRPCTGYVSGMRVQSGNGRAFTYPDVVVTCGEARYRNTNPATLLNPTVIVEVQSPTMTTIDEAIKFRYYRDIESLMEFVRIVHDEMIVEHFSRLPNGDWLLRDVRRPEDSVVLSSIDCRLPLSEVYDKVEFPPKEESELSLTP